MERLIQILVLCFFITLVCADYHYVTFWPKEPNNGINAGIAGEPLNNDDLLNNWLARDVAGKSPIVRNLVAYDFEGKGKGSTFFFGVSAFDTNKLAKYQQLQFLRAVVDHTVLDINDPNGSANFRPSDNGTFQAPPFVNGTMASNMTSFSNVTMQKRDAISYYINADRPLRSISSPSSQNNQIADDTCYYCSDIAGLGSRVYVLEAGINSAAENYWYSTHGRKLEWIFPKVFEPMPDPQKVDPVGVLAGADRAHGTCMASFAVGGTHGVAKLADVTAVIDTPSSDLYKAGMPLTADGPYLIDALSQIVNDVISRGLYEKAVVLMSWNLRDFDENLDNLHAAYYSAWVTLFRMLNAVGASLVVAQPNSWRCDGPPCWFSRTSAGRDYMPFVITVGPVDIWTGLMSNGFPSADASTVVYGPADDYGVNPHGFVCPDYAGTNDNPQRYVGTSTAAAFVAGLLSYYKGLGLNNVAAKERLLSDAYARNTQLGPAYIFNGVRQGELATGGACVPH